MLESLINGLTTDNRKNASRISAFVKSVGTLGICAESGDTQF